MERAKTFVAGPGFLERDIFADDRHDVRGIFDLLDDLVGIFHKTSNQI
jgi:hypothetical protein